LLPDYIKIRLQTEFQNQLERYKTLADCRIKSLTNFRNKEYVLENLIKEIESSINSLQLGTTDVDLVIASVLKFKQLDTMRKNSVVDAFPALKEWFEIHGY